MINNRAAVFLIFLTFVLTAVRIHESLIPAKAQVTSMKIQSSPPSYQTPILFASPSNSTKDLPDKDWIYPNSQVEKISDGSINIQSTDPPNQISNWYKNKIESENFTTKSFSSINSNGNLLSNLQAANLSKQVDILIKKLSDQSASTIDISIR